MAGHCLSPTILRGGLANPQEVVLFSQLLGMPVTLCPTSRRAAFPGAVACAGMPRGGRSPAHILAKMLPAHLLKGQRYRAIVQRDPALSVTSAPLQGHPSYSSCVMLAQCDRLPLSSILLPRGPRCLQSREGDSSTHTGTYVWCVSYALGFSGNWCVGLYRWNTQGSKMHHLLGLS